jgi:hypothetical protein
MGFSYFCDFSWAVNTGVNMVSFGVKRGWHGHKLPISVYNICDIRPARTTRE